MSEREIKLIKNLERKLNLIDNIKLKKIRFKMYDNNLEDRFIQISYKKREGFLMNYCIDYHAVNPSRLIKELKRNHYSVDKFVREFMGYL